MGKTFNVDSYEKMGQISQKLAKHAQEYNSLFVQLFQKAGSMGATWEGEDNVKFVEQLQGCANDLKAMSEVLFDASNKIEAEKNNYKQTQEGILADIPKLPQ